MRAWRPLTALAVVLAAVCTASLGPPPCLGATPSFDGGIVIDNRPPEYTEGGTWQDGKNQGNYYTYGMDDGDARKTMTAGSWAQWTANLKPGRYRVYLWRIWMWAGGKGAGTKHAQANIQIRHKGQTTTLKRDMWAGPAGWNSLGDYDFSAGGDEWVKITLLAPGTLYADAVKFLPIDKVDKTTFPAYPKPDGSTPRVENGNIVVSGQPRLILYGSTMEDTMAWPECVPYYGDQFDKWKRQGLNTLGAILQWNAFEPREDQYEYAMIDGLIAEARARNMHLIIVWFGTWRNLNSGYVPAYIWDEGYAFEARKKDGSPVSDQSVVSAFATRCAERDGLALNKLLARAALKDPDHQVLVGVQVENEMPAWEDYCSAATAHSLELVPRDLLDYLEAHDTATYDPKAPFDPNHLCGWTWSRYHSSKLAQLENESGCAGRWKETFSSGKGCGSEDYRRALALYFTGKYLEIVVRKAKEALDIPVYVNTWCGASPSDWDVMDIFHVGCPSLDGMGPDGPGDVLHKWIRPWNKALVEPEFSEVENYFRALSLGAMLSGTYWSGEVELVRGKATFNLVRTMEPLLVQKRSPGDLLGFTALKPNSVNKARLKGESWEQNYQNLAVKFTTTADPAGGHEQTTGGGLNGNGLIITMGPNEYIITSTKIDVELRLAKGGDIGVALAEQGHFESGKWVKDKDAAVQDNGASLKLSFPTENWKYGQIRLKIAAPASKR